MDDFTEPSSGEEALRRKAALQDEVEQLQEQLADKGSKCAPMTSEEYVRWRSDTIHQLHSKQKQLRRLKEWLRLRNGLKMSEWALLGRVYRLLTRRLEGVAEAEALLDEIEFMVPGSYLLTEVPTGQVTDGADTRSPGIDV